MGRARCWFDTRHAASGWRQALPWACPVRPPAVTVNCYSLRVDSAGRSVGAGRRNRPCVTRLGIAPARGRPAWSGSPAPLAVRGPHTACRARRRSRCRETTPSWFQLPWPRSRACRFRPWIRVRSPATPPSPRAGHPLHPMTAGHATGPKQGRDYRDRRPDRRRLRIGYSRLPGGAAKAVLSPSSPPPERPWAHSLRGVPGSRGGCAPVV